MAGIRHILTAILSGLAVASVLAVSPAWPQAVDNPSLGVSKGYAQGARALRRSDPNMGAGNGLGGAQGVAAGPVATGRMVRSVNGADRWGRPDKRFTGQRCETIENDVRVLRGC